MGNFNSVPEGKAAQEQEEQLCECGKIRSADASSLHNECKTDADKSADGNIAHNETDNVDAAVESEEKEVNIANQLNPAKNEDNTDDSTIIHNNAKSAAQFNNQIATEKQSTSSGTVSTSQVETGYVDLQDVSRESGSQISPEDEEKVADSEEDKGELSEDKQFETVMRLVIHSIKDITRSTDVGSDVDPFVEIRANQILLGATRPKTNMTTASIEEAFFIKTKTDPKKIKLKFQLKDQDHMTDDDLLGTGYFDLGEEDNTLEQTVHLKWNGKEIGDIVVSVDFQKLVVV